jgi:16S rRNA (adenine1518-N6/adenine1519-N6)-dimethyltransferase
MKKLGQHFLKNAAVLEKIVSTLALADGDRIIEIGPGHGELTAPLIRAAKDAHLNHCEFFCIEKDHSLVENLELFAANENSVNDAHIKIIEGDALKLLPEIVARELSGASLSRYKIVGNIPYYITGKLLRTMSELESKPERTVLLIQKEVAERICAVPRAMNRLAASVQFWANAEIVAYVPRKDFFPAPDVDSAVVMLDIKTYAQKPTRTSSIHRAAHDIDPSLYYGAVRAIFAQPRKTLLNNLSAAAGETVLKNNIGAQIKKMGIDPDARPQDLSIDQIASIANLGLWK